MTKLIILDRDGVINFDPNGYIKHPSEWGPIPESLEAMAEFNRAGYTVAVATNQSGIGRGYFDLQALEAIHQKMCDVISAAGGEIDKIFFCPHHPNEGCKCRKPRPGLLEQAFDYYNIAEKSKIYYVGDSFKDIQAAKNAKCTPALVLTGNGKQTLTENTEYLENIKIFENLKTFSEYVL